MARSELQRPLRRAKPGRTCARRLIRLLPLSSALVIHPAGADAWRIVPTLSVAEHYTDNVGLAPAGSERSAWVTQAQPGISVNYLGNNLKFTAAYTAEILYRSYLDDKPISVEHQFNGTTLGSLELVPQFLFLDTSSRVAQQNISSLGPQALDNISATTNRATVRTTTVSPYIRYNWGSEVRADARYTYSMVSSDSQSGGLSDSTANRIDARLSSGPAYKLTTWDVVYSQDSATYSENAAPDTTIRHLTANVRRLISPNVGVLASVGYDDNDYQTTTGSSPKGHSWNVGLNWTPTPRTNLTATTGRRYYGPSHSLDFSHRTRLTTWSLGYNESITTTRAQFAVPTSTDTAGYLDNLFLSQFPDPILRQQAVQQFITQSGLPPTLLVPVNFFSDQVRLQKAWRGSVAIQGVRHTVVANFFLVENVTETPGIPTGAGDFAASSTVNQNGTSLAWNWRATQYTSSNLSAGYTRSEFPGAGRDDTQTYVRLGISHQFAPKLTGALNFRRLHNESSQAGAGYTEHSATAQLQMTF